MQFSDTHAWLLRRGATAALAGCDVERRELKNASEFQQVQPRQSCRLVPDDPAFELGPPCEGCGKPQWILPHSVLRGPRSPGAGLSVFREPTVCVEPDYDPAAGVYQSDFGVGRFEFTPGEKPRVAGAPFRIGSYLLAARMPRPYTLVRADVMERLLALNLRGLAFRPVRIHSGRS